MLITIYLMKLISLGKDASIVLRRTLFIKVSLKLEQKPSGSSLAQVVETSINNNPLTFTLSNADDFTCQWGTPWAFNI